MIDDAVPDSAAGTDNKPLRTYIHAVAVSAHRLRPGWEQP